MRETILFIFAILMKICAGLIIVLIGLLYLVVLLGMIAASRVMSIEQERRREADKKAMEESMADSAQKGR